MHSADLLQVGHSPVDATAPSAPAVRMMSAEHSRTGQYSFCPCAQLISFLAGTGLELVTATDSVLSAWMQMMPPSTGCGQHEVGAQPESQSQPPNGAAPLRRAPAAKSPSPRCQRAFYTPCLGTYIHVTMSGCIRPSAAARWSSTLGVS